LLRSTPDGAVPVSIEPRIVKVWGCGECALRFGRPCITMGASIKSGSARRGGGGGQRPRLGRSVDFLRLSRLQQPDEIGVELNLIFNSNDSHGGKNVLMDVEPKSSGFNHLSFRVPSIRDTIDALNAAGVVIKKARCPLAAKSLFFCEIQTSTSWS
jgi:hypothetical protein